jgi:hypothetical protein
MARISENEPREIVWPGPFTFTSPSVYLAFNTLAAIYPCNWRPSMITSSGIITLPHDALSSIVPNEYSGLWEYSTRKFNFADLHGALPHQAWYASKFLSVSASSRYMKRMSQSREPGSRGIKSKGNFVQNVQAIMAEIVKGHTMIIEEYNPMIAIPSVVATMFSGQLSSCRPLNWNGFINSDSWVMRGVWDPPVVVPQNSEISLEEARLKTNYNLAQPTSQTAWPSLRYTATQRPGPPKLVAATAIEVSLPPNPTQREEHSTVGSSEPLPYHTADSQRHPPPTFPDRKTPFELFRFIEGLLIPGMNLPDNSVSLSESKVDRPSSSWNQIFQSVWAIMLNRIHLSEDEGKSLPDSLSQNRPLIVPEATDQTHSQYPRKKPLDSPQTLGSSEYSTWVSTLTQKPYLERQDDINPTFKPTSNASIEQRVDSLNVLLICAIMLILLITESRGLN